MRVPDHSTIAEFRRRHERALGELFAAVLALCQEAGLVEVGVIPIDGVKIRANASRGANRAYEKLVADILKEAAFQSLALTPAARTVIRTWPGPGCGSGRSTISRTSGLRTD